MKTFFLFAAIAVLFVGCDARVNVPPAESNTTIVNPAPEKKVETNTTIVNPPVVEKKVETKTTETTQ
jgi:hypothetical protein